MTNQDTDEELIALAKKCGDKVTLENGEEATVVHVSKKYEPCDHEWPESDDGSGSDMGACCTKCGMSFTRYVFMECP